jgi:hypothetical protein
LDECIAEIDTSSLPSEEKREVEKQTRSGPLHNWREGFAGFLLQITSYEETCLVAFDGTIGLTFAPESPRAGEYGPSGLRDRHDGPSLGFLQRLNLFLGGDIKLVGIGVMDHFVPAESIWVLCGGGISF